VRGAVTQSIQEKRRAFWRITMQARIDAIISAPDERKPISIRKRSADCEETGPLNKAERPTWQFERRREHYHTKMATPDAKAIYKQRAPVAEFSHARMKGKLQWC
jgi:hypothetical protein